MACQAHAAGVGGGRAAPPRCSSCSCPDVKLGGPGHRDLWPRARGGNGSHPPFFIRIRIWSARGRVRSWAMDRTLLGAMGLSLFNKSDDGSEWLGGREAGAEEGVSGPPTHFSSSGLGGISIARYSLQEGKRAGSAAPRPCPCPTPPMNPGSPQAEATLTTSPPVPQLEEGGPSPHPGRLSSRLQKEPQSRGRPHASVRLAGPTWVT